MDTELHPVPGEHREAHVAGAPTACFFDSELHLLPGVTVPLRSMLVETDLEAILVSPVGSVAEQAALLAVSARTNVLVAPSLYHYKFLEETRKKAPILALWGPPGLAEKVPALTDARVFGKDPWPFGDILPFVAIDGAPKRNEIVFFHQPSRTIYTADLVHAISEPKGVLAPIALRAMGIYKRLAMAKPWKHWVEDRYAFRRSIEEVLAWDFDRIAMAHGDVIDRNGRELLIRALHERDLL
jgi:hypothetical protein